MTGVFGFLSKGLDAINSLNSHYFALSVDEQKAMTFVERIRYYNWTFEGICVVLLGLMYAVYVAGTKLNERRSDRLFEQLNKFFWEELQFARVGFSSRDKGRLPYISDRNGTWCTAFATGRTCVDHIVVKAHYPARFNPVGLLVEKLLGMFFPQVVDPHGDEFVQVTVTPNGKWTKDENSAVQATEDGLNRFRFIASIVNKNGMNDSRGKNYFLSLTHTSEGETLPMEYVFMSENNQLNKLLVSYMDGEAFRQTLKRAAHFLRFIAFTDLPEEKPVTDKLWEANQKPRCVIQCSAVLTDADVALLRELIAAVVAFYDVTTREIVQQSPSLLLTNETLRRSVQLRKDELSKIVKIMKQVEREMAQEKKAEEEKKKRRELRDSLSGEQQDKLDQKLKQKRDRRKKNKQALRV
ncbi:AAR062Cp [Eremothecium gossypii ATCC 10895]|uniref:AAR062Cp n=1 Tax=Eremothecium gossypii (strain ATCC 10895 / CBS 109.51 / FGSC 9923 / NRRL Y-1056) TaxID=284811 RepID=Q75EL7_EREGS|nr:AAR062Cp [Eremothecium gossypii ATCC 10895]AAS50427.1 AAR062Cp [Eremothecium gossypii ATCC 10895]AEY94713.1 FAAR062Cp [Eremothecium gossypii FDAG1]